VSATTTRTPVVLEPAAQAFAEATATPPFLYELTPDAARKVLDDVQAAPIDKLPVDEHWITVPAEVGDVRVRIVRPPGVEGALPVVLYMHGGGWILGNAGTHDRLVRELAVGAGAAVAFVEYDRSPEARYPVAIEQGYATARWIVSEGSAHGLDPERLAVAGDSVGSCMTAALTLMAQERGDVRFVHQSMYYPVTDAAMDTGSYAQFAEGYYLTANAMAWFWDAYAPDVARRDARDAGRGGPGRRHAAPGAARRLTPRSPPRRALPQPRRGGSPPVSIDTTQGAPCLPLSRSGDSARSR
jgi:acetyl esterase